jgi:hypothetical protein
VVHGCYQKHNGDLRLVRAGRRCARSERAIVWNQKGQAGATGPRGASGLTGANGSAGPIGPSNAYEVTANTTSGVTVTGTAGSAQTLATLSGLPAGSYASLSNELTHTFGSYNSSAHLDCSRSNSSEPTFSAFDTKIIAIKVGSLTGP